MALNNSQLVIQKLNLLEYFPDIDFDLITLAITPVHTRLFPEYQEHLERKYRIRKHFQSYNTLEFYGDTILTLLLIERIREVYGLDIHPQDLTEIKINFVRNDNLTLFTRKLDFCKSISGVPNNKKLPKHNICADAFEAILGVLYYQYGLGEIERIKEWFFSLEPIRKHLEKTMAILNNDEQKMLLTDGYIQRLKWIRNDTVENFTAAYQREYPHLKLEMETYDNTNEYYIYNPIYKRKFYVGSLDQSSDLESLKKNLIAKNIWIPI